ncbi:9c5757ce-3fd6-4503-94ef-35b7d67b0e8a [Sclerotinia trifoliorum]|uniref:9c5757ce-3fd6-4503-94ef-35b7d67b0e8a n=1 Tax=Sclerotinia trifoliorum TaxID=28548 RepID=A0A8H2VSV0_9HELO|nr:9c5757ce-3fd6-4503-94ef-35b7d67b0e8a [Sclerotinia trifoliorum]
MGGGNRIIITPQITTEVYNKSPAGSFSPISHNDLYITLLEVAIDDVASIFLQPYDISNGNSCLFPMIIA